jgi:hypothetical protein
MKYVQPYGIADPDAPYINGDPSIARQGSIPPAAAFEHPMRELVAVEEYSMLAPSSEDLAQVAKGVRSQRMNYVDDTGSANTLSVAFDPPLPTYTIGFPIRVKIKVTNTGPTTIDAGAGRVSVRKPNGAEMAAGDLPAGGIAGLVFDGTNFQMINFGGAGGGPGNVFQVNIPYAVDTGPVNQVTATFTGPALTLVAGLIVMVKIKNTNTSFATLQINALPPKQIYAQGGTPQYPLLPCDMVAGDVLIFVYDGTQFWIYANDIINIPVTFNLAGTVGDPDGNTTKINDLFFALGRKRILTTGGAYVTINLAGGTSGSPMIYHQFQTQHPNADRITVAGKMLAARPVFADFARTGNSAAARANDSANNIAMLRTRYGTEVQFTNSTITPAVGHYGGGRITFQDFLITGSNVPAGATAGQVAGIGPAWGASIFCSNVTVWGSGSYGFIVVGGHMECTSCFAVSCQTAGGFHSVSGASMPLSACGAFGNTDYGVMIAGSTGFFWSRSAVPGVPDILPTQVQCNGVGGVLSIGGSNFDCGYGTITGNPTDLIASTMSMIGVNHSVYGTASPAVGQVGNGNSLIT